MLNLHTKAKEGFKIAEVTADMIAHVSTRHNSYGFFFFLMLKKGKTKAIVILASHL